MLRQATRHHPILRPSDLEMLRSGPSYMVDTLRTVAQSEPGRDIFLILGIDAYAEIDTWHRPEDLLPLAHIIVTTRSGHDLPRSGIKPPVAARADCCYDSEIGCHKHKSGHRLLVYHLDGFDVSSSEIRRRAASGMDVAELTGPEVAEYIRTHHLYEATSR